MFSLHSCLRTLFATLFLWLSLSSPGSCEDEKPSQRGDVLVIIGSPGTDEYHAEFLRWADHWKEAASAGQMRFRLLGGRADEATLPRLREAIASLQEEEQLPAWIVLLGHGTFDGLVCKFNLPEADLQPEDLQKMIEPLKRPLAILNCASASAPFVNQLSAPGRVVITSTSNGNEINFSRFGGFLAESLQHPEADVDKDGQVSLLEAFLRATRLTENFYTADGRLATEHAVLDDNGDAQPVPGSSFKGIHPVSRKAVAGVFEDGVVAHQWVLAPGADDLSLSPEVLAKRHELERQIAELKKRKSTMNEDDYYAALKPLFLELARTLTAPTPADE
ncbi:hypothetical protein SH661x_004196 [Planctomicrobium sp. SH661]|uniref:hypothetical protein n=1 Tax=Planctomicrobium sp. SH661 TaxID=3448124 RepID=UPI003F5CA0D5